MKIIIEVEPKEGTSIDLIKSHLLLLEKKIELWAKDNFQNKAKITLDYDKS